MHNQIVKIISLFNRTDKMRALGKVSKGATGYIIMGKYSPPRSYPIINDFVDLHLYYCIVERKFKVRKESTSSKKKSQRVVWGLLRQDVGRKGRVMERRPGRAGANGSGSPRLYEYLR